MFLIFYFVVFSLVSSGGFFCLFVLIKMQKNLTEGEL